MPLTQIAEIWKKLGPPIFIRKINYRKITLKMQFQELALCPVYVLDMDLFDLLDQ